MNAARHSELAHLYFTQRQLLEDDDPDAFDWPLLLEHLEQLVTGHRIEKPVYSFVESVRTDQTMPVPDEHFVNGQHVVERRAAQQLPHQVRPALVLADVVQHDVQPPGHSEQRCVRRRRHVEDRHAHGLLPRHPAG